MQTTPEELSPLAAYEELMRFAQMRGEAALRLALHASVPQGFHPALLHLLKRNFVPEAGDDPTIEVDVLFSPLCEDLGRGYFRFDPQVRTLLLDNLSSNYAGDTRSRIYRVANFLLFYVDQFDHGTATNQDQLWRDYLEMQRWVAFAFVSPESAARQLAAALENADSTQNFAARMQLGGLASALATPMVGYRSLLNYAAGLQALELGNQQEAEELFTGVTEDDLKVGDTVLRPASKIMEEWHQRNRTVTSPPPPEQAEEVIGIQEPASTRSSTFVEAIESLKSERTAVRRGAAEILADVDAPPSAVPALIGALKDSHWTVRQAALRALTVIGNEAAILGLLAVAEDIKSNLRGDVIAALSSMRKGIVLILGRFKPDRESVLKAIRGGLRRRDYVPLYLGKFDENKLASVIVFSKFIIADITEPRGVRSQLKTILPSLKIPVKPLVQGQSRVYKTFSQLQHYSSLLKPHRYDRDSDLLNDLTENVIPSLELWVEEVGGRALSAAEVSGGDQPAAEVGRRAEAAWTAGKGLMPDFDEDIFINYNHEDNRSHSSLGGWVDLLHKSLATRLTQLVGDRPKIWRDIQMTGTQDLTESIVLRLSRTAFIVSVISPSYVRSRWCTMELSEFYRRASNSGGIRINNKSRIFKVVKTPIGDDPRVDPLAESDLPPELRMLLQESLGYNFYEIDEKGTLREFWPDLGAEFHKKFLERLEDLAHDIKDFIINHRAAAVDSSYKGNNIYLAETTPDLSQKRDDIKRTLQQHNYHVLPDENLPFDARAFEEKTRVYLEESVLSIHLIGADHTSIAAHNEQSQPEFDLHYQLAAERVRKQHALAMDNGQREPKFRRLVWIPKGLSARGANHRDFISYLQNDPAVYEGAEVLSGASLEDLKTIIQRQLFDKQHKSHPPSDGKQVYLICDKQDLEAVIPIRDHLAERGFEVVLPFKDEFRAVSSHKENLRLCDAVLIYYGSGKTAEWKLRDLRRIDALRVRPLLAKAIYVGGPETEDKAHFQSDDALVIKNFGEFTPTSMQPFVDQFGRLSQMSS